jgi:uncharacterized protein YhaN
MRLRRIDAVRFGSLPQGATLGELGDGLTVVLGPNEAGKTSFTTLVRHVLYGFPNGRSAERLYLPPDGDKRWGRLVFADGEAEWVVERVDGAHGGTIEVRGPDSQGFVERVTAGVTPDVYRSIFGFGLDELGDLDTLNGIQQRLYATAAGLRVDPQAVRQELKGRAEELWSQAGRTKVIHKLNTELAEVRKRIRETERDADAFRAERAELDRLTAEAAVLETAAREARLAAGRLASQAASARQLDAQVRGAEGEREELRRALALAREEAEKLDIDEQLLSIAETIDDLAARAEWFHEATLSAEGAGDRARDARRAVDDALTGLGPSWDEARVAAVPVDTSVDSGIDMAEERIRESRRQLDETQRLADDARTEADLVRAEAQRVASTLGLSANDGAHEAKVRLQAVAELVRRSPSAPPSRVPAIVAAVLALVMGIAGAVLGNWPLVAGALLPLGLAAYLVLSTPQLGDAAGLLAAAGLSADPEAGELLSLQERLQRFLVMSDALWDKDGKIAVLEGKAMESQRRHAEAASGWETWLEANGLAGAGEPLAARAVLREVRRAQQARERLASAEAEARREREACAAYARRVVGAGLLRETDVGDAVLVAAAVRTAREELAASRSAGRRAEELASQGDRITAELARLEERTAKASAELAAIMRDAGGTEGQGLADLEAFGLMAEQDAERAEAVAREALQRRSELAGRLDSVAADAEGARLRLEESGLVERLRRAIEQYAVAATALRLVEETLAVYERDRQPAIVKRAASIFETMTSGRYPHVVTPLGSFKLTVEDEERRAKEGVSLSRGTAEQLYLALRLAYIENLSDVHPALPVLMDDVLVNFDDEGRQAAAAAAVARFAGERQVVFFTCHQRVADLFAEAAPDHTLLTLKRC